MSQHEDPYRDLAQWLQEIARRTHPQPVPSILPELQPELRKAEAARRAYWRTFRQGAALTLLAGAWMQYYVLSVMLQIAEMRSVVVFV